MSQHRLYTPPVSGRRGSGGGRRPRNGTYMPPTVNDRTDPRPQRGIALTPTTGPNAGIPQTVAQGRRFGYHTTPDGRQIDSATGLPHDQVDAQRHFDSDIAPQIQRDQADKSRDLAFQDFFKGGPPHSWDHTPPAAPAPQAAKEPDAFDQFFANANAHHSWDKPGANPPPNADKDNAPPPADPFAKLPAPKGNPPPGNPPPNVPTGKVADATPSTDPFAKLPFVKIDNAAKNTADSDKTSRINDAFDADTKKRVPSSGRISRLAMPGEPEFEGSQNGDAMENNNRDKMEPARWVDSSEKLPRDAVYRADTGVKPAFKDDAHYDAYIKGDQDPLGPGEGDKRYGTNAPVPEPSAPAAAPAAKVSFNPTPPPKSTDDDDDGSDSTKSGFERYSLAALKPSDFSSGGDDEA